MVHSNHFFRTANVPFTSSSSRAHSSHLFFKLLAGEMLFMMRSPPGSDLSMCFILADQQDCHSSWLWTYITGIGDIFSPHVFFFIKLRTFLNIYYVFLHCCIYFLQMWMSSIGRMQGVSPDRVLATKNACGLHSDTLIFIDIVIPPLITWLLAVDRALLLWAGKDPI